MEYLTDVYIFLIFTSSTCLTTPISVIKRESVGAELTEILQKFDQLASRLSRSLKVIEIYTNRSATYDFLLVNPQ